MSKFCPNCGAEANGSAYCPACGGALAVPSLSGASSGNGLAIAALVLAIFPYTTWIGLILGYVARSKNKTSKQARAAIIIGWIVLALEVLAGVVIGVIAVMGGFSSGY